MIHILPNSFDIYPSKCPIYIICFNVNDRHPFEDLENCSPFLRFFMFYASNFLYQISLILKVLEEIVMNKYTVMC